MSVDYGYEKYDNSNTNTHFTAGERKIMVSTILNEHDEIVKVKCLPAAVYYFHSVLEHGFYWSMHKERGW